MLPIAPTKLVGQLAQVMDYMKHSQCQNIHMAQITEGRRDIKTMLYFFQFSAHHSQEVRLLSQVTNIPSSQKMSFIPLDIT